MEKIQFKCTLLSDVVLSQSSATKGNKKSIDFIPGNNFLGIVAGNLYRRLEEKDALYLFHSGNVRFGDANPSENTVRGLKVPCSMYYPKLQEESEGCYIHHLIKDQDAVQNKQLKQCRSGFYSFNERTHDGMPAEIKKTFSIKSAYDSENRRSKDKQMYGYEALLKGLVLYFEIELEENILVNIGDKSEYIKDLITKSLCGTKHIGRSRTAQYGLVDIEVYDYREIESQSEGFDINEEQYVTVYADGRLIFLDHNGYPTFTPTHKDLKIEDEEAKIIWKMSQIRTFQYAPWNSTRQSFDTDRCGIEKGSVFVVKCKSAPKTSQYVGYYKNEGFGKVIYNPVFLNSDTNESNGVALFKLIKENKANPQKVKTDKISPLIAYLSHKKEELENDKSCFDIVNKFVDNHKKDFKSDTFASQWGSIRSLAMVENDKDKLIKNIDSYLEHGIAKEKWEENNRKKSLDDFMNEDKITNLQEVMINLASEMAKLCKKENENERM